jgi:hypothetical protein
MTTVVPEGEAIRKAVKWISDNLKDDPDQPVQKLINDANLRFNLTPKDAEYLFNFYRKAK